MQQNLKNLKRNSLEIKKGMEARWQHLEKPKELEPEKIIKGAGGQKVYATGNNVVAYIVGGKLFVTPYAEDAIKILSDNGYTERSFFVPFSPATMTPNDPQIARRWQDLVDSATHVVA